MKREQANAKAKGVVMVHRVVVLAGESGVGKTAILSRFLSKQVPSTALTLIGAECVGRRVTLSNGASIMAEIWDTQGATQLRLMTSE